MRPGLKTVHCHDTLHLCLVIDGTFHQHLGTHTETLAPASVRVSPPGAPATLTFGPAGARCLLLEFSDLEPNDRRFLTPERPVFLPDEHSIDVAWQTYDAFRTPGEAPLVLDTCVVELFARAARAPNLPGGAPPRWLRQTRDWLHDAYEQPLTLADAAVEAGVSPVHLSRAFRHQYGATMGDYLRAVRLTCVQQSLRETATPISQVALDAGFYDQSHMTRCFKQAFGMTPGAYRRLWGAA